MLCMIFQEKWVSCFIPLMFCSIPCSISLHDCIYFLRYWVTCVLQQLFVSQVVTLYIWKLALSFLSSRFSTWPKSQRKHLNILRMKRAFKVK